MYFIQYCYFSWLRSSLISKLKTFRKPAVLQSSPGIGIISFHRIQQSKYFYLMTGADPAPETLFSF